MGGYSVFVAKRKLLGACINLRYTEHFPNPETCFLTFITREHFIFPLRHKAQALPIFKPVVYRFVFWQFLFA